MKEIVNSGMLTAIAGDVRLSVAEAMVLASTSSPQFGHEDLT